MTTISLNATEALLDLMTGRADARKVLVGGAVADLPPVRQLGLRLLPARWTLALERRARQREFERAFARLAETSAHLLADVGLAEPEAVAAEPAIAWTRALPAPGPGVRPAKEPRSRHRLGALSDHLLADMGLSRAQAGQEMRRPHWDAPNAWLR